MTIFLIFGEQHKVLVILVRNVHENVNSHTHTHIYINMNDLNIQITFFIFTYQCTILYHLNIFSSGFHKVLLHRVDVAS